MCFCFVRWINDHWKWLLSPSCNIFSSPHLTSKNLSLSNRGFYTAEADPHQFLSPLLSAQSLTFPFDSFFYSSPAHHTIIHQRGEKLHTCGFLITNVPDYHRSPSALCFTLDTLNLLPLSFTTISFQHPLSRLLFGADVLPCLPFFTVSLCMALHVAITRPLCPPPPPFHLRPAFMSFSLRLLKRAHPDCCQVRLRARTRWASWARTYSTHVHRGIFWSRATCRLHLLSLGSCVCSCLFCLLGHIGSTVVISRS